MVRSRASRPPADEAIRLRGVRQNNLRGVDCDIPLRQLTVITGPSGSGKSSLAFDTLYAEGQRRYVETFSAYTRQFLDRLPRPDADSIESIPPAIAIDQAGAIKTSRSTVGTLTGINDYLKLLWARRSQAFCPRCSKEVRPENATTAAEEVVACAPEEFPAVLVARVPLRSATRSTERAEARDESPSPESFLEAVRETLVAQGLLRFRRCDGAVLRVEELEASDVSGDSLDVVIDRWTRRPARSRAAESLRRAFRIGHGSARLLGAQRAWSWAEGLRCASCSIELPGPSPGLFTFNTPRGACPSCRGFGRVIGIDWERVAPNARLSIRRGAIRPFVADGRRDWQRELVRACAARGIDVDLPWGELSGDDRSFVLFGGSGDWTGVQGFFSMLEEKKYKMAVRVLLSRYRGYFPCPDCRGRRLRPEADLFRIGGRTLPEFWQLPVRDSLAAIEALSRERLERPVELVVGEILSRLRYLDQVGLDYLTLDRQSRTLSGGEVERVNLTAALGASLVDTLFVLDEPSIGLHPRDNDRLLEILRAVRDRGNTVVVVEHDLEILSAADWLIDLGPGSGQRGGEIVACGTPGDVARSPRSPTGAWLAGAKRALRGDSVEKSDASTPREAAVLSIRGAREHNLCGLDIDIPFGGLTAVTGVSGSGKSTLIEDVIWRSWLRFAGKAVEGEIAVDSVTGFEHVDEVVLVDQSPIGRTPRGNPLTYTKVFDAVREIFAGAAEASGHGFHAGHFSFNSGDGRCPECRGAGFVQVEMQFLADVFLPCESCRGRRFRDAVLAVEWRGRSIAGVLDLTIDEAGEVFHDVRAVREPLAFLSSLGLGYLRCGQPVSTLSGGEAQRLKLARKVIESGPHGRFLFLLDEPTTGLHLDDVQTLLDVLDRLVRGGHGVVVIEHHLDVIAHADHVIDLGPEGGDRGGRLIATGSPAEIAREPKSITGAWLRKAGERSAMVDRGRQPSRPPSRAARVRAALADEHSSDHPNGAAPSIRVVGARENNLRDIDVEIPRGELVVVTGLSGAGKSSLVYDIIFSEGQRRYLDCLSPYARQFVENLHRPDIDHLEGIPPTVAIEQRTTIGGRKSTVGTVTEIWHFLRLLLARAGVQYCPRCDVEVLPRSTEDVRRQIEALGKERATLLAPVVRGKKGFHNRVFAAAQRRGIERALVDGSWLEIPPEGEIRLERHRSHDVELAVAELPLRSRGSGALDQVLASALELGEGVVRVLRRDGSATLFNVHRSCPSCGDDFSEPDPRNFSFHSRHGRCPECGGLGVERKPDPELLIESWNEPLDHHPRGPLAFLDEAPFPRGARRRFLREFREAVGDIDDRPLGRWPRRALEVLLRGRARSDFAGLLGFVEEVLEKLDDEERDAFLDRAGRNVACESCGGSRLAEPWSAVRLGGHRIVDVTRATIGELRTMLAAWTAPRTTEAVTRPIIAEIDARLGFLVDVGLDYLSLDRSVPTLSGGEAQRIRLAAQLGSSLRGACYILDEPTIGLHARDNARLISTLRDLRDAGNSVIVIEHDDATIEAADHVIDMGPGPGRHGGRIVAQGTLAEVRATPESATGIWFEERDRRSFELASDPFDDRESIVVLGARQNNLRGIDVRVPLGALTVVTGVSGAGKSTLVRDVLEAEARRALRGLRGTASGAAEVRGLELLEGVREVDQLPIGRTPRSTPATYVGLWDRIRRIYAAGPEARARGYAARRFSFNTPGGRCDACAGQGRIRMEMDFLPDVWIDCETCGGKRFAPDTLEISYQGRTIADVLAMSIEEAHEFFANWSDLRRSLRALLDLGLGYLTLGQASTTLSGGEAQRVKLAVELAKTASGRWLYLFDEPTTGLHMKDVEALIAVLRRLARAGHAVVVIEHQLEVIAGADWVIDLGPEGGTDGGELVYEGPPAGLLASAGRSHTGRALTSFLRRSSRGGDPVAALSGA